MTLTCPECNRPYCPAIRHEIRNGVTVFWCGSCGAEWQNPSSEVCPFQGSELCKDCPYRDEIEIECDWNCAECPDRGYCPCSVAESAQWVMEMA